MSEPSICSSRTLTDRMVALGGVKPADTVSVMGPGALDMVVDLCRGGFEHVTCGCAAGLTCAGEHSGAILVTGALADHALAERLRAASAMLAQDGVLVLRLIDVDQDPKVVQALERAGFEVLSAVYDLSGAETLVAHRLSRAERLARAA